MQNVLVPGAVGLLAVFLWLQRKPVKPMLSSTDASAVAQLNRTQLELVIETEQSSKTKVDELSDWTPPVTVQETISLQQALRFGMNAGPEERPCVRPHVGGIDLSFRCCAEPCATVTRGLWKQRLWPWNRSAPHHTARCLRRPVRPATFHGCGRSVDPDFRDTS